jgi:hypothetical protein
VHHLLPGHGRPVSGRELTARALGPGEGLRGVGAVGAGLARCFGPHRARSG